MTKVTKQVCFGGRHKLAALLAVSALCAAASAEMLDTSGFTMKRTVTFSGYAGSSNLENFPALVRLPADVSSLCATDGADIRFTDADGNLLNHEVDTWNANGESCVWVCVPSLSGTTTSITLYYSGEPTQTVNPRLVWGLSDYKAVWHFSGSCADSSTNALECLDRHQVNPAHPAPSYAAEGPVGTAYSSPAQSYVQTTNDVRWAAHGNKLSLSGWVKAESGSSVIWGRIMSSKSDYAAGCGFELTLQGGFKKYNMIGHGNNQHVAETQYDCMSDFVYLTAVFDGSAAKMYANGTLVGNWDNAVLNSTTNILRIGANAVADNLWYGQLDEMRLRWGASSADWVAADYATQHSDNFAVLGAAERIDGVRMDDKPFRRVCTVTFQGYAGSTTLRHFPALVRIPAGSPIYSDCAADGSDIRFADTEGYMVDHEIDTWNANGESLIWVRVPQLAGTDTALRMYFRCQGENVAVNPRNVWRYAGYKGVWHFSGSNADSSPNALVCSNSSTPPSFTAAGQVGTAFSGEESFVQTPNDPRWAAYGSELTLSCWVKASAAGYNRIITSKNDYTDEGGFEFTMQNAENRYNVIGTGNHQNAFYADNCVEAPVYLTAVMSNGGVEQYSNGVCTNVAPGNCPLAPSTRVLGLGKFPGSSNYGWRGTIDEIRLRWAASSADWVVADYATQYDAEFAVLGEIEKINAQGAMLIFR